MKNEVVSFIVCIWHNNYIPANMPEGPSISYIEEKIASFAGKKVTDAGGYTPMPTAWLKNKKLLAIKGWGKHLLLCFKEGTVRIHLGLFGSLLVNERKKVNETFYLRFGKNELNFYVVRAKLISEPLDEVYDWRTDIMSPEWKAAEVKKKLGMYPDAFIGDVLLNQEVFTGVGNIIRNESLFFSKVHPLSIVKNIPEKVIAELIRETRRYGKYFLREKKKGTFGDDWKVHQQEFCPRDENEITVKLAGKTKRKAYYCEKCQVKY